MEIMDYKKDIDVLGIGVSTLDILNVVDHFPDKEEVQKSLQVKMEGGGPVSTAIVTLARLGAKTILLDSLGDDWIGKNIVKEFEKEKVITKYIKINNGLNSSLATVLVRAQDGARTIIYSPGNSPELNNNDIYEEIVSRARYIHINGRHIDACIEVCKIAKKFKTLISFDGGSFRFREELRQLFPFIEVCIVSKDFAEKSTNEIEIPKAAIKLLEFGPSIVVITDGLNGSWLFTDQIDGYYQKAFIVKNSVDTTGCGDSYHGAFLYYLIKGHNLFESIKFASAVAALNTRELGGRSALPTLLEAENFTNEV